MANYSFHGEELSSANGEYNIIIDSYVCLLFFVYVWCMCKFICGVGFCDR